MEKQLSFDEVIILISSEFDRAITKFPEWPIDIIHAFNIITEEYGELSRNCNQFTYEPDKTGLNHIRSECIQLAAMAIRFLMHHREYLIKRSEMVTTRKNIENHDNSATIYIPDDL